LYGIVKKRTFRIVFVITTLLVLCIVGCQTGKPEAYIFGNRIPKNYFITWGQGESDVTIHAGSYDDALRMAKVENYNIMVYSSVLPPEAREIPIPTIMHHGAVLETIMAEMSGKKGEILTAGLILAHLRRKSDQQDIGGFVAEYHGNEPREVAEANLRAAMQGMFERRYNPAEFELYDIKLIVKSFVPKKKFGTIMVIIGFANYIFPQVEP